MKWAASFMIILTALLVIGFMSLSNKQTQREKQAEQPTLLKPEHSDFDFGIVSMAKGKVQHAFTLTNTSDKPEIISSAETSCMCTEAMLAFADGQKHGPFGMPGHGGAHHHMEPVSVQPGETLQVETIFDPTAHGPAGVGKIARDVYVRTVDGRTTTLSFAAEVTP